MKIPNSDSAIAGATAAPPRLLIFPVLPEMSLEEFEGLFDRESILLASSAISQFEFRGETRAVRSLPNIHDAGFADALVALIHEHQVTAVSCPVTSVHAAVGQILSRRALPVVLLGVSPHLRALDSLAHARERALRIQKKANAYGNADLPLNANELTALVKLTSTVYGECSDEKLAGLVYAMSMAAQGEVVEIGVLFGKSALALGYLADRVGLGQVLAVDPWEFKEAVQIESPLLIQQLAGAWDLDDVHRGFLSNMAMLPRDRLRYLRMTSVAAAEVYKSESANMQRISMLHVDGNHDEQAVRLDCKSWFRHLLPGAWIVLDDYEWSHGSGPRIVGDELLSVCDSDIEQSFVAGKALFIKGRTGEQIRRWAHELK